MKYRVHVFLPLHEWPLYALYRKARSLSEGNEVTVLKVSRVIGSDMSHLFLFLSFISCHR